MHYPALPRQVREQPRKMTAIRAYIENHVTLPDKEARKILFSKLPRPSSRNTPR